MQAAMEMELLSTYCAIALTVTLSDRHEIYLSLGHFAGKAGKKNLAYFKCM